MQLPAIKLPEIPLPFDIPTLMHPPVVHFVIAIPVLVLLIEIINLVAKKRAIGFTAFFLLIVGAVAAVGAYLTGIHDGKEAFDALSQAGQAELKEHRLLGTYLMLASGVVVVFKLLSAMIQRGLMKATYLLVLIVFIAGMFKQGKDGGELVYEYGANVERVQELDSDLFDAKEELSEAQEKLKELEAALSQAKAEAEKKAVTTEETQKTSAPQEETAAQENAESATVTPSQEDKTDVVKDTVRTVSETAKETVQEAVDTMEKEISPETTVEEASQSVQENAVSPATAE
jgi:uncharacterized membrane protein